MKSNTYLGDRTFVSPGPCTISTRFVILYLFSPLRKLYEPCAVNIVRQRHDLFNELSWITLFFSDMIPFYLNVGFCLLFCYQPALRNSNAYPFAVSTSHTMLPIVVAWLMKSNNGFNMLSNESITARLS